MPNKKQKITIITSLNDMSFDIISSMLAAHKIHKDSFIVFEPSNPPLKHKFINSMLDLFKTLDAKELSKKIKSVKKLILIGGINKKSNLLKEIAGDKITLYSDNNKKKSSVTSFYEEKSPSQSIASLLALKIKKEKIRILPEEATIISLGIYDKTKSFSLSTTTKEDFLAVSFLKESGAKIALSNKIVKGEKKTDYLKKKAKEIMTFPPLVLDHKKSCKDASIFMTQYSVNSILITDKHKLLGYISRSDVEKALFHKLGKLPVSNYMKINFQVVDTEDSLKKLQDKMTLNNQRILPVIRENKIVGVITRTDILTALVRKKNQSNYEKIHKFTDPLNQKNPTRKKKIANFMKKHLDKYIYNLLLDIGEIATKKKQKVYIVGGFVRDLLLYKKNYDIDIVVEGNAIKFAKDYAKINNGSIQSFEKFGTAYVKLKDGFKIDFASARTETYTAPAALPKVQKSSINLDLFRRDFTINTLIIQLNTKNFGELIDHFSAQKDLKDKKVRVLHNFSFIEDPTRIFRAARFEQRFAFEIGITTSRLIDNAIKTNVISSLKGLRIFTELKLIFEEDNPFLPIKRLFGYGVFLAIYSAFKLNNDLANHFKNAGKAVKWQDKLQKSLKEKKIAEKWILYFFALTKEFSEKESLEVCKRLDFTPKHTKIFSKDRFKGDKVLSSFEKVKKLNNSTIYKELSNFSFEIILYLTIFAKNKKLRDLIRKYYTDLRFIYPFLKDKDLQNMGIKNKAKRALLLKNIRYEKLDENLRTKEDEIAFVNNQTIIKI